MVQLDRINHAVNDLLSYARPSPPMFEEVCINEVIQKTLSLLMQQANSRMISFSHDLPSERIVMSADRKQFQQVLWNICLNGLQSMESGGKLSVVLRSVNATTIRIQIRDQGRGIPAEQLVRVFQPFFTTKHKGTGLGMTISKRIVEQHGGSITLDSVVDRGTTVTIDLPIHRTQTV
jgi:signal transduction histidine kinase